MVRKTYLSTALAAICACCFSCSEPEQTENESPATETTRPAEVRTTVVGRWLTTIIAQQSAIPLFIVDINETEEGKFSGTLVDYAAEQLGESVTLTSTTLTDGLFEVELDVSGFPLRFQGSLKEAGIVGSLVPPTNIVYPGRMIAAKAGAIKAYAPQPELYQEEWKEALEAGRGEQVDAFRQFIDEHEESSLALNSSRQLLKGADENDLAAEVVAQIADKYIAIAQQWGPSLVLDAQTDAGSILAQSEKYAELAYKYATEAEQNLPEEAPERWKIRVALSQGRALIRHTDREKQEQGAEIMRAMHAEQYFNMEITEDLLNYVRIHGELDEAIQLAAQLAALPPTSTKMQLKQKAMVEGFDYDAGLHKEVADLWVKKHGSLAGLESYLDEAFKESLAQIVADKVEPRSADEANRVAICELFTGSSCPPCIAADIGLAKLEYSFSPQDLITLRYHQHIPAPDPLVNTASEERFFYYRGQGTPMVFVNGMLIENPGGVLDHAAQSYGKIRALIEPTLSTKTKMRIKLSAEAKDDVVAISAVADDLGDDISYLRMRLALTEDKIHYPASNGIRIHEHVVRAMPGGSEGIDPQNGRLEYAGTVDLKELRRELTKYLADFEKGQNYQFDKKPIGLDRLHLVCFIQDDFSKKIFQAAQIPVSGLDSAEKLVEPSEPAADTQPAKQEAESREKPSQADLSTEETPAEETGPQLKPSKTEGENTAESDPAK